MNNFFKLYYAPNNAILSIVGDFDPAQAKQWIAKYFGGLNQSYGSRSIRSRQAENMLGQKAENQIR